VPDLPFLNELVLVDKNPALTAAWEEAFADFDDVRVLCGDFFAEDACALVSPANSFGFMDGGLDAAISEVVGRHLERRVQAAIVDAHRGELAIGQALTVDTDHKRWPRLIVAPTMRVPGKLSQQSVNAFLAMRALLVEAERQRREGRPMQKLVVPGLCSGIGGMTPRKVAMQMRLAFNEMRVPARIPSMSHIHRVHGKLLLPL